MGEYILEMKNIAKIYGNGVVANSEVNFNLKEGEIHALVGENGAGKSTLMKILFGMEQPSRGEIFLRGEKTVFSGSKDAIAKGIGMVHQHFMLVESFTVAQNIVLGMEPKKRAFVDEKRVEELTREISEKYNLQVDPQEKVRNLPVGLKQKVEILKALARGAKILILDEPTAVLVPQETEQLFHELMELKKQGYTIVFISHKVPEIKQISDRITVIRRGRTRGTFDNAELTEDQITNLIMGCEMDTSIQKPEQKFGEKIVSVENLSYTDAAKVEVLRDVSFGIKKGMIFGLAGVQGNGQVELVQEMTKALPLEKGDVLFHGESIRKPTLGEMRKTAFGYIPEDRLEQGVAASETIQDNMISNKVASEEFSHKGFLKLKQIEDFVKSGIEEYEIRCTSGKQQVGMLSGGDMQKVVVARECGHAPEILIAEQPTRGVDVGAAHIIHQKLVALRNQGCAILLVSADLNEVLKLSDVVAVMYDGEIVAYFEDTKDLNEEKLGLYMLGIERHDSAQIRKAVNDR